MQNDKRGRKPEWKVVKTIDDGKFAVQISATDTFRPRYSVQVGKVRDGQFRPHLPIETEGLYKISLVRSLTKDLAGLLQAAEEWILEEAALRADESLDKRIEKEQKSADFGKQQTRVTGKTAKKKARLRQAA